METQTIEFNHRKLQYRKWKVKDKKSLDNAKTEVEKRKVYVYNCLIDDNNTALDLEEYNYVLSHIRDFSLDSNLQFETVCDCKHSQELSLRACDIISFKEAEYKPVVIGDDCIEFGNVEERDAYESTVINANTMSERYVSDLAFHIRKINSNDVQYEQVIGYIENLDVSLYEKLFDEWEQQRCKCRFTRVIKCEKCGKETEYSFDDVKDFFPRTWSI